KVPQLQEQARKKEQPAPPLSPLVRAAASAKPEQLLEQVRRDPDALAVVRQEWLQDALERGLAAAKQSPAHREQFGAYYTKLREKSPDTVPYTFEQYVALQKVRPQGQRAFGEALQQMMPTAPGESEAQLRADFEAAKKHELFQEWWSTSTVAKF